MLLLEVQSTANFLIHLMNLNSSQDENEIDSQNLNLLNIKLQEVMCEKYGSCWREGDYWYGSGRRIIRVLEENFGPYTLGHTIIYDAAIRSGLSPNLVISKLPYELTMWINPGIVTARIMDSYFELFDCCKDDKAWTPCLPSFRDNNEPKDREEDAFNFENWINNERNNYDTVQ